MLELTIESYNKNTFYRSQNVYFVDLLGTEYQVVGCERNGVNFLVETLDINDNVSKLILGGHEKLYVDYEMEALLDGI